MPNTRKSARSALHAQVGFREPIHLGQADRRRVAEQAWHGNARNASTSWRWSGVLSTLTCCRYVVDVTLPSRRLGARWQELSPISRLVVSLRRHIQSRIWGVMKVLAWGAFTGLACEKNYCAAAFTFRREAQYRFMRTDTWRRSASPIDFLPRRDAEVKAVGLPSDSNSLMTSKIFWCRVRRRLMVPVRSIANQNIRT